MFIRQTRTEITVFPWTWFVSWRMKNVTLCFIGALLQYELSPFDVAGEVVNMNNVSVCIKDYIGGKCSLVKTRTLNSPLFADMDLILRVRSHHLGNLVDPQVHQANSVITVPTKNKRQLYDVCVCVCI